MLFLAIYAKDEALVSISKSCIFINVPSMNAEILKSILYMFMVGQRHLRESYQLIFICVTISYTARAIIFKNLISIFIATQI